MCLLAILFRVCSDAPVVVAANREEFYDRGGLPPGRLEGVAAVGGRDPRHGGTWLGINAHGLLVAVTNRRRSSAKVGTRSRGLLVRDLLACRDARSASLQAQSELQRTDYEGCNLLCIDQQQAVVLQAGDLLRVMPLPPGIHVLANRDVNDPTDPRINSVVDWLAPQDLRQRRRTLPLLAQLCASRQPGHAPICFRAESRGTVSSSLIALGPTLRDSIYLHAQGPPDSVAYEDVSHLLHGLDQSVAAGFVPT